MIVRGLEEGRVLPSLLNLVTDSCAHIIYIYVLYVMTKLEIDSHEKKRAICIHTNEIYFMVLVQTLIY